MTTIYLVFACWAALGTCNTVDPPEYGAYTNRAECEKRAAWHDRTTNSGTGHPGLVFKCMGKRIETWH